MEEIELNSDEKLEDLQIDNFYIVQSDKYYRFSMDSVELSNFAKIKTTDNVLELCSGSGVISFLIYLKYRPKTVVGIEIDKNLFLMSQKSLAYNKLQDVNFINDDICNYQKYFKNQSFDTIVCNPPYYVLPSDTSKIDDKNLQAKYELSITLPKIFEIASKLLKNKGNFYVIYPSARLQEVFSVALQNKLFCKQIKFVKTSKKGNALAMFRFVKNGRLGIDIIE